MAEKLEIQASLTVLLSADTEVSFDDLCAIADYFRRPWSYLLPDVEERLPDLGQDHRTYSNRLAPLSADTQLALEAAERMLDASVELFPDDTYSIPREGVAPDVFPPSLAAVIRAFLSVSEEVQLAATDAYAALRVWTEALQRTGLYVAQRPLRDGTVRAFSALRDRHAVIVVDSGDTPYARSFSLVHEYCHIVLRTTGVCDLDQHTTIERYCNDVAARVLMPDDLLQRELAGDRPVGANARDDDELLRHVSRRLGVSQAALLIRLRDADILSDELYDAMERRRQARRGAPRSSGGDFYATAISHVGRRFAGNVFGALAEDRINRADAAVLLGIGEHLMSNYRRRLFPGALGTV
ncbi:MAG: ImmA/IrrE family metallo-endopeptidase [Candidatus Dormibacteria bacterium]